MSRRLTVPLIVMVVLAISFATHVNTFAAPPAASPAKVARPEAEVQCVNYAPGGEYLGTRFILVPRGSSPEAHNAMVQNALIQIAVEHGRADLVANLMKEPVRYVDKEAFAVEAGFTGESLWANTPFSVTPASMAPTAVSTDADGLISSDQGFSTETVKRRPPHRGGICTCASLVCSADVCGKFYCSGACGGCNLCG